MPFAAVDRPTSGPHPWPLSRGVHAAVHRRIDEVLIVLAGPLLSPASRIVHAPGKLLRPALALTVAGCPTAPTRAAVSAAAAVELLHCATLVHDDLIDGASTRRGVPTVNAVEGVGTAVVTGDLLIAAAHSAAAAIDASAGAVVIETLAQLCVGQALEDQHRFDATIRAEDALAVARGKTGSLLRAACLLGAHASGAPAAVHEAIGEYGSAFGVAMQLVDDLLDLLSTSVLLGKPVGSDFAAGTMTLPVLLAVQQDAELAVLLRPALPELDRRRAAVILRSSPAIGSALAAARDNGTAASRALEAAGDGIDPASRAALREWPRRYVRSLLPSRVAPELRGLRPLESEWHRL